VTWTQFARLQSCDANGKVQLFCVNDSCPGRRNQLLCSLPFNHRLNSGGSGKPHHKFQQPAPEVLAGQFSYWGIEMLLALSFSFLLEPHEDECMAFSAEAEGSLPNYLFIVNLNSLGDFSLANLFLSLSCYPTYPSALRSEEISVHETIQMEWI